MKFFKVLDTKEAKKIVKDNIEAAALKVTSRKTSDAVGYTVSDAVFGDSLTDPHQHGTSGCHCHNSNNHIQGSKLN